MNPYKVFLKHVFGAKYEGVKKSVFAVAVIFLAIFATEIKMVIAPSVLFLTAIVFSAGVMWQVLSSKSSMENLRGALVLPFENRQLVLAYVFSLSAYTLLSKSALILALFFALGTWRMEEVIIALLCAIQGCLFAVMGYLLRNKAKCMLILLLLIGYVAAIFYLKSPVIFGGIVFVGLLASIAFLFAVDAYDFYNPGNAKKILKNSRKKGSFFAYAIRYLLANKNYMVNTVGLCVIACVLPIILNQFGNFNLFSIGLAILSINTPLCILLSVDRELEQAVRMLPGQELRFGIKYCIFLATINILLNSVYLASWQFQLGNVSIWMIIVAGVFAVLSALCSVVLEWVYPLRNWQVESDLYHHPRKYIVPAVMMILAGIVSLG